MTTNEILVGDFYYSVEDAASPKCHCRRCRPYKEDFGGCVVLTAASCFIQFFRYGASFYDHYAMYSQYWD